MPVTVLLVSCSVKPGDSVALRIQRYVMTGNSIIPLVARNQRKQRTILAGIQCASGAEVDTSYRVTE